MLRTLVVAFVVLLSSPIFAVDLTVDMKAKVLMPDGKTVQQVCREPSVDQKSCARSSDETIDEIVQGVLLTQIQSAPNQPDLDSGKAGALAIRIYGKDRPSLTHEESVMILKRGDKVLRPLENARLHEAIEPVPTADAK